MLFVFEFVINNYYNYFNIKNYFEFKEKLYSYNIQLKNKTHSDKYLKFVLVIFKICFIIILLKIINKFNYFINIY